MERNEKVGCLFVLLKLLGLGPAPSAKHDMVEDAEQSAPSSLENLPYQMRDGFLSEGEKAFFRALVAAVAGRALICAKVNVADLLCVAGKENRQAHQNRIDRKHVDFLLCSLDTIEPVVAIELDDKSHQRADRVERDALLNAAFAAAGLPLLRFTALSSYNPANIAKTLEPLLLASVPSKQQSPKIDDHAPRCRKCGDEMVRRTAAKGNNPGKQFYGCPNYPRCREMVEIT